MQGWVIVLLVLIVICMYLYYNPSLIAQIISMLPSQIKNILPSQLTNSTVQVEQSNRTAKFQTQASTGPIIEYGNMQPDAICQKFCMQLCATYNLTYGYSDVNKVTVDAYNNKYEVCDCGCN